MRCGRSAWSPSLADSLVSVQARDCSGSVRVSWWAAAPPARAPPAPRSPPWSWPSTTTNSYSHFGFSNFIIFVEWQKGRNFPSMYDNLYLTRRLLTSDHIITRWNWLRCGPPATSPADQSVSLFLCLCSPAGVPATAIYVHCRGWWVALQALTL